MRILVVSDTHGDKASFLRAVRSQPSAEVVIHLGDGAEDFEEVKRLFPERMFLGVRGNGDWGSSAPLSDARVFEGKRFFFTHGHRYNVKMGYYSVYAAAREQHADVLLFGHTHLPLEDYEDGLYVLNPGSLHASFGGGSYGTVDLTPAGIVTNLIHLK